MEATLSQRAYEALRRRISRGAYPAGARLVNRVLARELGISFTPVREAINRLASEGIVRYERGSGAFVRQPSRADVDQLFNVLDVLCPLAATEAAQHGTPRQGEELARLCSELRLAARQAKPAGRLSPEQAQPWLDLIERFQSVWHEATANRYLAKTAHELHLVAQTFAAGLPPEQQFGLAAVAREWLLRRRMCRALERRDAATAERLVAENLRQLRGELLSLVRT